VYTVYTIYKIWARLESFGPCTQFQLEPPAG
jgi:hypothetical protein